MAPTTLLAVALTLAGCQNKTVASGKADDDALAAGANVDELTGATWLLTTLGGGPVDSDVDERPVTLDFAADGTVSGFAGCNPLTGNYALSDGLRLRFADLGVGLSLCPRDSLERQVLDALNTTDNYTLRDGQLSLNVGRRAPLAVFSQVDPADITNKYWRLVTLGGETVEVADNQEREQYFTLRHDGTVTGFAGCNRLNGSSDIDASAGRLAIGENLATTRMACPDPAIREGEFLAALTAADRYTVDGETLTLQGPGNEVQATFKAIYF